MYKKNEKFYIDEGLHLVYTPRLTTERTIKIIYRDEILVERHKKDKVVMVMIGVPNRNKKCPHSSLWSRSIDR